MVRIRAERLRHSYFIMVSFGCWGQMLLRPRCNTAEMSEILQKRLSAGTVSASICHLKCHPLPSAALMSAEGLPQLMERSQPDPWSICLQDLHPSGAAVFSWRRFRTPDDTFQEIHDGPGDDEEELLDDRSSTRDLTQVQAYLVNWRVSLPANDWAPSPGRLRCYGVSTLSLAKIKYQHLLFR